MRIMSLGQGLIDKFTPIPPGEKIELFNEAKADYDTQLALFQKHKAIQKKITEGQELTEDEKAFKPSKYTKVMGILEMWQVRMVIAILFPVIVKKIQDWLYSPKGEEIED